MNFRLGRSVSYGNHQRKREPCKGLGRRCGQTQGFLLVEVTKKLWRIGGIRMGLKKFIKQQIPGGLSNRRDWLHFLMRNYNFTSRMCTKRTFTRLTIKDCGIRVYDWFPLILMIPSRTAALIPGTSWTPLEKSPLLGCTHLIQIKTRHVLPTDNWHWRWKASLMKVNKLGQVHTAVNPCPQCKVNGYKTYGQFTKKHTEGL